MLKHTNGYEALRSFAPTKRLVRQRDAVALYYKFAAKTGQSSQRRAALTDWHPNHYSTNFEPETQKNYAGITVEFLVQPQHMP